ncbi:PTS sugar transporter subunit IIA [Mesorhizobium sp. SB112]|uniref:PTS sugar transporter subunit IIA n=1 Tax=Mesorhizobium sp. SB112 TaxID=3151853 RepID=UPI00326765DD
MDSLKLFLEADISLGAVLPHKDAVIALAADRLAEKARMSYEQARSALADREKLGSTALGQGVAMPHAMTPHCRRPACALIGLSSPVDFDAPDGEDVDVVLALIWPEGQARKFVEMSSSVSRILRDPATLRLVRKSADPDLIRRLILFRAQADTNQHSAEAVSAMEMPG